MSFKITSVEDVYKFAPLLYDYLSAHDQDHLAEKLSHIVDSCCDSAEEALESHHKAFSEIRYWAENLPAEYRTALDSAIDLTSRY